MFYVFPISHVFTLPSSCVSPRLGVDPPNSGTDFLLVPYTCNQDTNKKIGDFNQTFKHAHDVLFQNKICIQVLIFNKMKVSDEKLPLH